MSFNDLQAFWKYPAAKQTQKHSSLVIQLVAVAI